MKTVLKNLIFAVTLIAVTLAVWWLAAAVTDVALILPTPAVALKELWFCLSRPWLYKAVFLTLTRSLIGFALSFVLGVALSGLAFAFKKARKVITPFISVFSAIPTMSVILVFLIWFSAESTPIFVALLVVMPVIFSGTVNALDGIDKNLIENTRAYGGNAFYNIRKVYAPLVAPYVAETAARAISLNFKLVIAAEVLAQTRDSIGIIMQQAQVYYNTARLFAVTIIAVGVAGVIELAVRLIKRGVTY